MKDLNIITQVGEDVLELSQHHGAVLVLVVQLAELNVVVVVARALWGLQGLVDELGDVVEAGELLVALLLLSKTHADLLGDVEAQGVDNVSKEEHIELAFAIPVVDLADLLNSISISLKGKKPFYHQVQRNWAKYFAKVESRYRYVYYLMRRG